MQRRTASILLALTGVVLGTGAFTLGRQSTSPPAAPIQMASAATLPVPSSGAKTSVSDQALERMKEQSRRAKAGLPTSLEEHVQQSAPATTTTDAIDTKWTRTIGVTEYVVRLNANGTGSVENPRGDKFSVFTWQRTANGYTAKETQSDWAVMSDGKLRRSSRLYTLDLSSDGRKITIAGLGDPVVDGTFDRF